MAWCAIVFWNTDDTNDAGWTWRVHDPESGRCESGKPDSAEDGIREVRRCLRGLGIDPESVRIEVEDSGVWDKC